MAQEKTIYENYTIDEFGNVFSLISNKYLRQYYDKYGYLYVALNGVKHKVHRLVAEAFIPNPENKPEVDHADRNRTNNHVSNLKWATPKENSNNPNTISHLKAIGERYKTEYGKKIRDKFGNEYISIIEASRQTGKSRSSIQYHLKENTGEWTYV